MKNKKGQTALEFLLTYGWAILLITVVAILMWQWGLFNPGGQIQPGSSGFWGVVPYEDFRYTENGTLTIPISNGVGGEVTILEINVTVTGYKHQATNPGITISPGRIELWEVDLSPHVTPLPAKSGYNIFVSIAYNDSRTGEEYISSGWIWGNVEE
ncbi:MAG: hypothetical protein DRO89_02400 [Candidatus Altiarchaeales archaeon]|nr:MAG: hypothetical protein DRO89_02400 [Candidatus Altiarchaeales archaeon]